MGTNPIQSLTLMCDFPESHFYIVSINKKDLETIEIPSNIEWTLLVTHHRGHMDQIKGSPLYEKYKNYIYNKDLAIGNIADDRMLYVIDNFFNGFITDQALVSSISSLESGCYYSKRLR